MAWSSHAYAPAKVSKLKLSFWLPPADLQIALPEKGVIPVLYREVRIKHAIVCFPAAPLQGQKRDKAAMPKMFQKKDSWSTIAVLPGATTDFFHMLSRFYVLSASQQLPYGYGNGNSIMSAF